MSEEILHMFLSEPGQFTVVHGVMVGATENIEEGDSSPNCITLVFIDLEGQAHPLLMHPKSDLVEYLISDTFRDLVQSLRQKLVDKDAR